MENYQQIAGSRLMIGFDGLELTDALKHYIKDFYLGGVILFKRNIEDPKQVFALCEDIQSYAKKHGLPPLFIAIDQEGGTVSRLGQPFTQFPLGAPGFKTVEKTVEFAEITSMELHTCGINMDMAPVLDVAPPGYSSIMLKRMLGDNPQTVAKLGHAMIDTFQKNRIVPVGKHFPGIGRTLVDSHYELPVFDEDLNSLENFDLIPFKYAIERGLEAVMISHILYSQLDNLNPASVSEMIVNNLLRGNLGFNGVVLTDDMDMHALEHNVDFPQAIQKAMNATVDIMLICHESDKIGQAYALLENQALASAAEQEMAEASYNRIMALKYKYLIG